MQNDYRQYIHISVLIEFFDYKNVLHGNYTKPMTCIVLKYEP